MDDNAKISERMTQLIREANYAIASRSRSLVYQAYGKAQGYYECGAITWDDFLLLNKILVHDTLNGRAKELHV